MRKFKVGMRESKLFDTRIYPVVRLATKAHLHLRCWSTHKEYCFSATKSLSWTQSRSLWPRIPLRSFSTKEGGLHVPRTKLVVAAPRQAGGSKTLPASHQDSKDGRLTEYKMWFSPRTKAQGTQPCSLTHSRAKLVLNLRMWSICFLVGLEMFFNVSRVSLNSSSSKFPGGRHLYRPPTQISR